MPGGRRTLTFRDIVGNLWYCYVSRKMWEAGGTAPFWRLCALPLVGFFWAVLAAPVCDLPPALAFLRTGLIVGLSLAMWLTIDLLFEKSKPAALYYAKARLKVQERNKTNGDKEKAAKEDDRPPVQRAGNIGIGNVGSHSLKGGADNAEESFAVGLVARVESVGEGAESAGVGEGVQEGAVGAVERHGTGQVREDACGEGRGLSEVAGRAEAPALEGARAASEENLGHDHCRACDFEEGNRRLLLLAKRHLSGWPVEDGEGDGVRELVHGGAERNGKKRAQEKICDFLDMLQDDHLWTEFGRLGRVLLLLTAPLWVPMALISGGFRAAAPFGSEGRLRSFFEETYFFSFVSGVCFLVARLFAACC